MIYACIPTLYAGLIVHPAFTRIVPMIQDSTHHTITSITKLVNKGRCTSEYCPPTKCPGGQYSPVTFVPPDIIHR